MIVAVERLITVNLKTCSSAINRIIVISSWQNEAKHTEQPFSLPPILCCLMKYRPV